MQFSVAALSLLAVASTAAAKGINCEGSGNCNRSINTGVNGNEANQLKSLIDRIDDNRWYNNGQKIACVNWVCAFLQNTGGAPGRNIKGLAHFIPEHGCKVCGSVPYFYPAVNDKILPNVVQYVRENLGTNRPTLGRSLFIVIRIPAANPATPKEPNEQLLNDLIFLFPHHIQQQLIKMGAQQMQALVTEVANGGSAAMVKKSIPVPEPAANQALVRISHVAQNPTDVQSLDSNAFGDNAVLGCDFVGTVEKIGDQVSKLAKGDTIAGLIWGGEVNGLGAYSEYSLADERISFRVPNSISLEEAATLPLASMTAWLAFFSKDSLDIPRDSGSDTSVLIWGGSSSVGLYAVQIAALHGFNVITTCSPRHFDLVKSLGAKHAFDYRDDGVVESIKKAAPGLKYVFDTIGNKTSSGQASQAVDESGGRLCTVRPGKANTDDVTKQTTVTDVLVWTAFLKDHQYGAFKWPANEGDHMLATEFIEKLPEWVEEGKLKPNNPKVIPGGLDGVEKGFQLYRDGGISATKLVYKL
ncbi:hypothetical protein EsH8_II_001488 [Colletotrichum jinshuiense]